MVVFQDQLAADLGWPLLERRKCMREEAVLRLTHTEQADQMERRLRSGRGFFSTEKDLAR